MRMPLVWANCSGGISIIGMPSQSTCRALEIRRRRECGLQCGEFPRQHVAENLDMGNDVGAGDEAEIQLVAVALHGDVERKPMRRDRHRADVQQFRTCRIPRLTRPPHVGNRDVGRRRPDIPRTTSFSLARACLASGFACDNEIYTPAKLRSDEIDLFRIVEGDTMLAMLSRDFGSEIFPTTSETLLSMVGMLAANFTADSIWNMALSNRIDPRSLFPDRGSSMPLAAAEASNGLVQSC